MLSQSFLFFHWLINVYKLLLILWIEFPSWKLLVCPSAHINRCESLAGARESPWLKMILGLLYRGWLVSWKSRISSLLLLHLLVCVSSFIGLLNRSVVPRDTHAWGRGSRWHHTVRIQLILRGRITQITLWKLLLVVIGIHFKFE